MNIKQWHVSALNKDRAAELAGRYGISSFLAMLLDIRGYTNDEEIQALFSGGTPLSDPFLMKDMSAAVARIRQAIDGFEKIAIFGDYDADGVTATAILYSYLDTVGADVMYYIPQREGEGYGMNIAAVDTLADAAVQLIITVDNGISAVAEIQHAMARGMDVVVTDHHRPHEVLPAAVAVVDPYQSGCGSTFKELCGAGVVLKLLIALEDGDEDAVMAEYADLAAIGTIADVMPLVGENRSIITAGLASLETVSRPGLKALLEKSVAKDSPLTARSLAFTLIPRINATGRMGSPDRAVKLLVSDYEEEATALAEEICGENDARRAVEAEISAVVISSIERSDTLCYDRVLVVSGEGWHPGVIGIVASRVTEHFGKPCLIISQNGEQAKGSGRSIPGFSLFDAICACSDLLEKFGGHPLAAGVTLQTRHIDAFRIKINQYAKTVCDEMPAVAVQLDCKLNPAALTPQMPLQLSVLEPFGAGNPQPVFGLFGMTVEQITPVGGGGHLRLLLSRNGKQITCMRFGMGAAQFPYPIGATIDLTVTLDSKAFRGEPQLTVSIKEMRLAGTGDNEIHSYRLYEKFKRGEPLSQSEADTLTPGRAALGAVYRAIGSSQQTPSSVFCLLASLQAGPAAAHMNLGKLLLCLEILAERDLMTWTLQGELLTCRLKETNGTKIDIFASRYFARIQQLIQ